MDGRHIHFEGVQYCGSSLKRSCQSSISLREARCTVTGPLSFGSSGVQSLRVAHLSESEHSIVKHCCSVECRRSLLRMDRVRLNF
jgi:hypothetical protein